MIAVFAKYARLTGSFIPALFIVTGVAVAADITVSSETAKFSVSAPYPNPFNSSVTIEYVIPQDSFVTLRIYDILGKK